MSQTNDRRSSFTRNRIEEIILFLGFIAFMVVIAGWWEVYQLNADEGINLQKAALVANGYTLYTEIWSDQPPALTFILSYVQQLYPFSVAAARSAILLFAAIMVVSLFRVVRRFEGRISALASAGLLVSSALFMELSVSVMIGLPAIALAVLALDIVTSGSGTYHRLRAIIGGAIFSIAMLTKFFVALALPALIFSAWICARRNQGQGSGSNPGLKNSLVFIGAMACTFALVFFATDMYQMDQLIGPHVSASSSDTFADRGGFAAIIELLEEKSEAAYLLGCLGILMAFLPFAGTRIIPLSWLLIAAVALTFHRPLWAHHSLLIVVPLCWLGGVAVGKLYSLPGLWRDRDTGQWKYARLVLLLPLLALFVIIDKAIDGIERAHDKFHKDPSRYEQLYQARIALFSPAGDWMITDRPIDAYRAGKLVPPELAVWSKKRRVTNNLSNDEILGLIASYPEAQVSLGRFKYEREFIDEIARMLPMTGRMFTGTRPPEIYHFAPMEALTKDTRAMGSSGAHRASRSTQTSIQVMQLLSFLGMKGIGGIWDSEEDIHFERIMSTTPLAPGSIVTRPPGSAQEIGSCLLRAWESTSQKIFLLEALNIGQALACAQTREGGWAKAATVEKTKCSRSDEKPEHLKTTFDDGTVTSALYFAEHLEAELLATGVEIPEWLPEMIDSAYHYVLSTQLENGGWPRSIGESGYDSHITLNDDAMTGLMRIMLRAYRRSDNPDYLAAARRAGDYLLSVQGTGFQSAFAQQYSTAGLPAPARKFEPPAYSSLETALAINALIDLYLATGETRYRSAAAKASHWLKESETEPQRWARFYELGSNRAIFADRNGAIHAELKDLPVQEQESYRWHGGRDQFPDIGLALDRMALLDSGGDAVQRYDTAFARSALLPYVPTARVSLTLGKSNTSPGPLVSSRDIVETCASILWVAK
ncbi:glycosyltransferase family 39 protein [bacterium]|nr:glycosyltransferase family 39 protein [bacterium]